MEMIRRMTVVLVVGLLLSAFMIRSLGAAETEQGKNQSEATEPLEGFLEQTEGVEDVPPETIGTEPAVAEHTHVYTDTIVAATCTSDGCTVHTCSCGHSYTDNAVAATGHDWNEWTVTTAATCKTEGAEVRTCRTCGQAETRSTAATGHTYSKETVKEPTCTEPGCTRTVCHCGDVQEETSVPALGHSYECCSATAATIMAEGWEQYICTQCGKENNVTLPKLSAVDADMCGESLLGKALPNAPYPEFSKLVMERWGAEMTYSETLAADRLPHPGTWSNPWEAIKKWEIPYLYITQAFSSTTHLYFSDQSIAFNCWAEASEYAQMQTVYARVYEILAELGIDESVTKKEAVTRINSWICRQKQYHYDVLQDSSKRDKSLYYSVFSDTGVCHNYALAFQVLCLGAGIECHYYESKGMAHAWNKVYFSDGTFLWVDVCWNDASAANRWFNPYLLITTEQLLLDHKL